MARNNCAGFGAHPCAGCYKHLERRREKRLVKVKILRATVLKAERIIFNCCRCEIPTLAFWEEKDSGRSFHLEKQESNEVQMSHKSLWEIFGPD